jgi:hypothetical protein
MAIDNLYPDTLTPEQSVRLQIIKTFSDSIDYSDFDKEYVKSLNKVVDWVINGK